MCFIHTELQTSVGVSIHLTTHHHLYVTAKALDLESVAEIYLQ